MPCSILAVPLLSLSPYHRFTSSLPYPCPYCCSTLALHLLLLLLYPCPYSCSTLARTLALPSPVLLRYPCPTLYLPMPQPLLYSCPFPYSTLVPTLALPLLHTSSSLALPLPLPLPYLVPLLCPLPNLDVSLDLITDVREKAIEDRHVCPKRDNWINY